MLQTVVGIYDELSEARQVVEDLVDAGFNRADISLVASDRSGDFTANLESREERAAVEAGEGAAEGALAGGLFGGLTGVLVGMGLFAIPGIGPVVAAGPIAAGLVGAGLGAATGGLLGALLDWGVPEEEAAYYTEGVRRGSVLIAVKTPEERLDEAIDIMESYELVDLEERAETWRQEGWTGYDRRVDTTDRTGRTRIEYTRFEPDYRRHHQETYASQGYLYSQIEPAYRFGYDLANDKRYNNRAWNEITLDARRSWETNHTEPWDQVQDAVRHGWQQVTDMMNGDEYEADEYAAYSSYNDYEPTFRQHYSSFYGTSGYPYDQFEPAYRYGYELANDERFAYVDWEEVEPEARRRWEREQGGSWEQFKDAVQHAWEEVVNVFEDEDTYEEYDVDEDEAIGENEADEDDDEWHTTF